MIKIRINDHPAAFSECGSEVEVDSKQDAIVYLWALAKQDVPAYGIAWLPTGVEPMTNSNMFYADPPASLKAQISEIVKTLNEQTIEALVVQGLNIVFNGLGRHGDDPEFVAKVTTAAHMWASDCYQ